MYRQNLPHCHPPGAAVFVTCRRAGVFQQPAARRDAWLQKFALPLSDGRGSVIPSEAPGLAQPPEQWPLSSAEACAANGGQLPKDGTSLSPPHAESANEGDFPAVREFVSAIQFFAFILLAGAYFPAWLNSRADRLSGSGLRQSFSA